MFSGLPYVISVLLCGLLLGAILAPLARSQSNSELAQAFYYLTALLLNMSYSINVWMILGQGRAFCARSSQRQRRALTGSDRLCHKSRMKRGHLIKEEI